MNPNNTMQNLDILNELKVFAPQRVLFNLRQVSTTLNQTFDEPYFDLVNKGIRIDKDSIQLINNSAFVSITSENWSSDNSTILRQVRFRDLDLILKDGYIINGINSLEFITELIPHVREITIPLGLGFLSTVFKISIHTYLATLGKLGKLLGRFQKLETFTIICSDVSEFFNDRFNALIHELSASLLPTTNIVWRSHKFLIGSSEMERILEKVANLSMPCKQSIRFLNTNPYNAESLANYTSHILQYNEIIQCPSMCLNMAEGPWTATGKQGVRNKLIELSPFLTRLTVRQCRFQKLYPVFKSTTIWPVLRELTIESYSDSLEFLKKFPELQSLKLKFIVQSSCIFINDCQSDEENIKEIFGSLVQLRSMKLIIENGREDEELGISKISPNNGLHEYLKKILPGAQVEVTREDDDDDEGHRHP